MMWRWALLTSPFETLSFSNLVKIQECKMPKQDDQNNPYQKTISEAYAGTVFINIQSVTATWKDCINHDVDTSHVDWLASAFMTGIDQMNLTKQLKLTITKCEWTDLLEYLTQLMNNNTISSPLSLSVKSSDLQSVVTDNNHIVSHVDSVAIICSLELSVTPVLEAGQHCIAALKKFVLQHADNVDVKNEINMLSFWLS